ncbi:MAG: hypothetical protein LBR93_00860 [Treponema sp.]|jgi:hypothetical protein|nr:hypothetical protein [Treponema sp.]
MLRKRSEVLASLLLGTMLAFVLAGCPGGAGGDDDTPAGSSVDDFSNYEPRMEPNPNLVTARQGAQVSVGIPPELLPAQNSRAAAVTALFECLDPDVAEIISQNGTTCDLRGLMLGNARIKVTVGSRSATVIIAVAPEQTYYALPASREVRIGNVTTRNWRAIAHASSLPSDFDDFKTEPTYRLAWNWRNPNQSYGASGHPCGIDILGYFVDPGDSTNQQWVRTSYGFGGWFYDLNGTTSAMEDGVQTGADGVKLELVPSFVYDNGVPYIQIIHKLTNTSGTAVTGQKFGASMDAMMFNRDDAPLTTLPYGALMTNGYESGGITYAPTIKLRLVCKNMERVNDVSTLWLGPWASGTHRMHIYEDKQIDVKDEDSAMSFSYQNIDLAAGQTKEFTIRFTLAQ